MIDLKRALTERDAWVQPKGKPGPSAKDAARLAEGIKGLSKVIQMLKAAQKTGNIDGIGRALRRASQPVKDLGSMRYGG